MPENINSESEYVNCDNCLKFYEGNNKRCQLKEWFDNALNNSFQSPLEAVIRQNGLAGNCPNPEINRILVKGKFNPKSNY